MLGLDRIARSISRRCCYKWTRKKDPRPRRSFHCRSRLPCEISGTGRIGVLVAVQLSVPGLYLPPVFKVK